MATHDRGLKRQSAGGRGVGPDMRDRIDRALTACEESNAGGLQRPPRWVLDLIGELQVAADSLVWEPADTVEAHSELLDLQVDYLRTPPSEALREARRRLARARADLSDLRKRLAAAEARVPDRAAPAPGPSPDLTVLGELPAQVDGVRADLIGMRLEFQAQIAGLRRELETMRMESTPREAEVTVPEIAEPLLRGAVEAARHIVCSAGLETDLEEIAAAGGASLALLRGSSRRRGIVELRRVAARYLRSRGCSLPEIGEALGRDHTTILHLLGRRAAQGGVTGRPLTLSPSHGVKPPARRRDKNAPMLAEDLA